MDVILFGCTGESRAFAKRVNEGPGPFQVKGFCDNDPKLHGTAMGLPVCSVEETGGQITACPDEIVCIQGNYYPQTRAAMITQLLENQVPFEKIHVSRRTFSAVEGFGEGRPMLPYLPLAPGETLALPAGNGLPLLVYLPELRDPWAPYFGQMLDRCFSNTACAGFCTEDMMLTGKTVRGKEVLSLYEAKKRYDRAEVGGVLVCTRGQFPLGWEERKQRLVQLGIPAVFDVPILLTRKEALTREDLLSFVVGHEENLQIDKLDYSIAEHCNLNCHGCTHFAGLVPGEVFADPEQFKKDIDRLAALFRGNIEHVALLGGEPLLHRQLPLFFEYARQALPYTNLFVITNGLLLNTVGRDVLDALKTYKVKVNISLYPPAVPIIDEVHRRLTEEGIKHTIGKEVRSFFKRLNLHGENDPAQTHAACFSRVCHHLKDGQVAQCYLPFCIDYFNGRYGTEIPRGPVLDIHGENVTAGDVYRALRSPSPLCGYCTLKTQFERPWSQGRNDASMEDWIV